jgi:hypothetical protein
VLRKVLECAPIDKLGRRCLLLGAKRTLAGFSEMADTVEKVRPEQAPSNNRIEMTEFLNRCCTVGLDLESMFRARTPKIVFQQYRPEADEPSQAGPTILSSYRVVSASFTTVARPFGGSPLTWQRPLVGRVLGFFLRLEMRNVGSSWCMRNGFLRFRELPGNREACCRHSALRSRYRRIVRAHPHRALRDISC